MTFSRPKRSPNVMGAALEAGKHAFTDPLFTPQADSFIYRLETFRAPAGSIWKRLLDIVISIIGIVLVSPLMVAAFIAVKLSSPGPTLFHQERVGIDRRAIDRRRRSLQPAGTDRRRLERRQTSGYGKPFRIFKFRTMVVDAEKNGQPMLARKGDPRITPIGAVMRKTRIDELPQFFNVLKGDMSIVGPRPERAYYINEMRKDIPNFQLRNRAKPGITGLAQVELGYANDVEGMKNKLRFDLRYIQTLSLLSDLKIMFKTITVVLTGKGAC
jgi:lipopolysaccharide/colanic/teichoic acid biosynthesis glycosyltransferase